MSTYEAKPGTGTGFAMRREAGDKRPSIELRLRLDRDYRAGDEIKVAGWKKDKLTSTGNVQFSLKIDSGEHQSAGGGSSRRDDDIPF